MTETSGINPSDIQSQPKEASPAPSTTEKPTIQIAGKYQSNESIQNQAAGNVPDITGETISVPNNPNMSSEQLDQQAQEERVLTEAEKQEQREQADALLAQLPQEVLEAKNPDELEEKIIEAQVAQTGESPEEAKTKWQKMKDNMIAMGGAVAEWFASGIKSSNAFVEILRMLLESNYEGRTTDVSGKTETGEKMKTRGEFIDKISDKPKLVAESLKKAYYENGGLKEKGLKIDEVQLQRIVETGNVEDLKALCTNLVTFLTEGDTYLKQNRWELFSSVFAHHLFDDKQAKLGEDVKVFLIEELVKDNKFDRYFGQAPSQQQDPEPKQEMVA